MQKGKDYIGVGVGAVIIEPHESTILLVKRKKPPEAGKWSIPGGAVDFGETFEAAVIREVKEEVGLEVEVLRLLRLTDHILPEEGVHWVTPAFEVRIVGGEAQNLEPDKHEAVEWFSLKDLPQELTMTTSLALASYIERNTKGMP
ncbi:MAG: NUDIX domain-containing protein [Alphaproteobacteria bacterium]|nr:NUDIX domain-containing protein [Alphaproteobacteria bacterium]